MAFRMLIGFFRFIDTRINWNLSNKQWASPGHRKTGIIATFELLIFPWWLLTWQMVLISLCEPRIDSKAYEIDLISFSNEACCHTQKFNELYNLERWNKTAMRVHLKALSFNQLPPSPLWANRDKRENVFLRQAPNHRPNEWKAHSRPCGLMCLHAARWSTSICMQMQ